MRIAIVGAGAVGSVVAGYLLEGGEHEVALLARGAQLAALRERGLAVESRGRLLRSRPMASDQPADLGLQDVLFVTVKAHALPALAPLLSPMIGLDTVVVGAQNGIPWWYFHGMDGPDGGQPFETVDPDGAIWRSIGPERALGCVINLPATLVAPGFVQHEGVLGLTMGAPCAGTHDTILRALAESLTRAGIETKVTSRIRTPLWVKLMLNSATGTLSVLTGGTVGQILAGPGMGAIRARLMRECLATARVWGVELVDDIDARIAAGASAAAHKTSMLQDYEAGRPLELDPIVAAVIELARRREVPVPTIETLWSAVQVKLAVDAERGGGAATLPAATSRTA